VPKRRQSKSSAVSSISSLVNAPENDLKHVPKLQLEGKWRVKLTSSRTYWLERARFIYNSKAPESVFSGVVFNSSPRTANNESCSKPASPKMETAMPVAINDVLGEFTGNL
jgi:hypothetical protein